MYFAYTIEISALLILLENLNFNEILLIIITHFESYLLFTDERQSETESQTNEDSSDTQISSSLNHTTIHGSTESIASKPTGKHHTNGGLDKSISSHNKSITQKIASSSGLLPKQFNSDSKMLTAVGVDSRPATPKDKDVALNVLVKGDSTPNSLKHKISGNSVKKSANKKARHR